MTALGGISSPALSVELYPIGGFCCVSPTLPPANAVREYRTPPVEGNGFNACFDQTVHCRAAEPHLIGY